VADEPAVSSAPPPPPKGNGGRRSDGGDAERAEFAALRQLLVGPEQNRLAELATEIRERHVTASDIAENLPEAIVLRGKRDKQIGRALAPTVETALRESIRRNPREIASAIFPILGPAIRKSIAETMAALVRSINSAVEHSLSPRGIKWRIESWRTGVPYPQVVLKHALVYRVEQAFLIHAESGLLLAHATAPGLQVPDADLISGMLSAIQDFVKDSFRPAEGATLRTFSVGEHTVQVEAGPAALLALVIKGEAPESVLRKQQDTLEAIHLQFSEALSEFNGDTAQFQSVNALLEDCLETVVDTGHQRRGRHLWMRWGIPVGVGALVVLVMLWRANMRFDRAVAALDSEPGLVILAADRGWGNWKISGLRDPQARSPEVVLAGVGLALREPLRGRWESYLSLDSAVVITRARQHWNLPGSTTLILTGDTLTASGEIPLIALGGIRRTSMPPGVVDVRFANATIQLPDQLDSVRAALSGERVLFEPGAYQVSGDERFQARTLAARFRSLHDVVVANGADMSVTMVGRTDPTGTDETNQALAQWRIDHIAGIFAAEGISSDRIRAEALASTRPLPASDAVLQARINRSVSFEINVTARPRAPQDR
jgi:outer membrane protein OmpA-like peptidoglycan-associated protein